MSPQPTAYQARVAIGARAAPVGQLQFVYEAAWLQSPLAFALNLRGPERSFAGSLGFLQ